jgi:hypothetical protein
MLDYHTLWPPLFIDYFQYRGFHRTATGTIPSDWDVVSGYFSILSERKLAVSDPGEMVYQGTSLEDLRREDSTGANYRHTIRFYGQENLKFTLRARRTDSGKFVFMTVDFDANQVILGEEYTGQSYTNTTTSHNFTVDKYYSVELWCYEARSLAVVNMSEISSRTIQNTNSISPHGFSLVVDTLPTGGEAHFRIFAVQELIPLAGNSIVDDPSNLILQFRRIVQEDLASPVNDWHTFTRMRKMWSLRRNLGWHDETWADFGYPWPEPLPEDWLITEQ